MANNRLASSTILRKVFVLFLLIGLATGLSFAGTYTLSVSGNSSRTGATALNGATVSGSVYVFTSPASSVTNALPTGIARVCYSLDNVQVHCESYVPYDYAGSTDGSTTALALPWDTTKVASGTHTISQLVTMSTGSTETDSATFTIGSATAPATASPSGTTIPSATQIVDSQGAVWTLSGGYIYRNGTQVPGSNAILLLYYNGIVYAENSSLAWWSWNNGGWVTSSDPRGTSTPVSITVSPTSASVQTGKSQQFNASVTGSTNTGVSWKVNGVAGGNTTVGTVSTSGMYTAPASVPSGSVTVTATSTADTTKSANSSVSISAPSPSTVYALAVSNQSSRSGGIALNGASVSGTEYIYTSPSSQPSNYNPTGITSVCYWLDNPSMSTTATHCEGVVPYDFAGTNDSVSPSVANGFNMGSLSGVTHSITQKVTMTSGATEVSTATFNIQVAALQLTTSSLPSAGVNQAYSAKFTATGGTSPYTWSIVSGSLPAGLSLSTSGSLTGTPTTTGSNTFSVQVKDSGTSQQAATGSFTLTVANVPPSIATTGLPIATVNSAYSTALSGKGGTSPYNWTITSGALPNGLSLSTAGAISGTPSAAGTFGFSVKLTDATGLTATTSLNLTVASTTSSTGFQKPYASTSFWNTPIPSTAASDPNSATMIQESILNYLPQNITFSNGAYSIPLTYANATDKVYNVQCTQYCNLPGGATSINFPIPAGAIVSSGTDHHLIVVYQQQDGSPYAGKELDMWIGSYNSSNDTWSAAGLVEDNFYGWGAACPLGQHCTGSVAAGWSGLGGVVRPEEIAQGHIDHALAIATPFNRTGGYFACPATNHDEIAGSSTALPQGAQIQLDPTFNVDAQSWPAWLKVIAHALQTYGAYNSDYAGVVIMYGAGDQNPGVPSWSSVGVPVDSYGDLNSLPWSRMRVISMTGCN